MVISLQPFHRRSASEPRERSKSPTPKDSSSEKLKGENYLRELSVPDESTIEFVYIPRIDSVNG
jgi:hypothetical protein